MAYLRLMSRASRNYETDAWVEYDTAFRRRAANCGSLDWGTIDSGLYNETFTGRARPIRRCSYRVIDTHALEECPYAPKGWSQQESGASHEPRAGTTQRTPGSARVVGRLDSGRSDAVEILSALQRARGRVLLSSMPICPLMHQVSPAASAVRVWQTKEGTLPVASTAEGRQETSAVRGGELV